jgi:hypothetical protein
MATSNAETKTRDVYPGAERSVNEILALAASVWIPSRHASQADRRQHAHRPARDPRARVTATPRAVHCVEREMSIMDLMATGLREKLVRDGKKLVALLGLLAA